MHTHKDGIDATLSDTKVYLDKLHQEISKTLEKVASKEKYINNQVLNLYTQSTVYPLYLYLPVSYTHLTLPTIYSV